MARERKTYGFLSSAEVRLRDWEEFSTGWRRVGEVGGRINGGAAKEKVRKERKERKEVRSGMICILIDMKKRMTLGTVKSAAEGL